MPLDDKLSAENIFKEDGEVTQAFNNLDKDLKDDDGMSGIDFNARLSSDQTRCILIIDEFTRLGLIPKHHGLTRQAKRLSVSLQGKGREEKVQIASAGVSAKRETGFLTRRE